MMLILISEAISNSNAVIRREFRKLRFQMIDDRARTRAVWQHIAGGITLAKLHRILQWGQVPEEAQLRY
jgi:hypothetical protein